MFVDGYIAGGLLASMVAFAFFWSVLGFGRRRDEKSPAEGGTSGGVTISSVVEGGCRSDYTGSDVIIVGAGVAGSALAHTLGKVRVCSL